MTTLDTAALARVLAVADCRYCGHAAVLHGSDYCQGHDCDCKRSEVDEMAAAAADLIADLIAEAETQARAEAQQEMRQAVESMAAEWLSSVSVPGFMVDVEDALSSTDQPRPSETSDGRSDGLASNPSQGGK